MRRNVTCGLGPACEGNTGTDGDLVQSSLRGKVSSSIETHAIVAVRAASLCKKRVSLFRLDSAHINVLAAFHLIHVGETRQLDS